MVHHRKSKNPYFLMSNDILESMKYSGSVSLGSSSDNGVFGMVFNFLSNRRFNVLKWSKTGLELWIVNTSYSNNDISDCLRQTRSCNKYQVCNSNLVDKRTWFSTHIKYCSLICGKVHATVLVGS